MDVCTVAQNASMTPSPYCLATVVSAKAIDTVLEAGGDGAYRDRHPWIVAKQLFAQAQDAGQSMPLLLAVPDDGGALTLSHWADIIEIEALELHRGQWDSICRFTPPQPMHPIWQTLDSVALKPTAEQLKREALEDLPGVFWPCTCSLC